VTSLIDFTESAFKTHAIDANRARYLSVFLRHVQPNRCLISNRSSRRLLSHDKYCSASVMLAKTAEITTSFELLHV